ncbi:polysaccharide lyase 6 family protein [Endozoicomonas atrinae]|uniref:polysaccharide lyase 6 family protein n=1 Tax=Endozoicomonas atrinae TaxID=1333660 RepID=UPI003B005D94
MYSKTSLVILTATISLLSGCATVEESNNQLSPASSVQATVNEVVVSTPEELVKAISRLRKGGTVLLESGDYADLNLRLSRAYRSQSPLLIKAKKGGSVFITGDTDIQITGKHITLSGLTFERGTRSGSKAELIYMEGEHNRITQSLFREVDDLEGVWVQMNGRHNRIDHSWFEGKTSGQSYINMDIEENRPVYHQLDHNYFTRPPLGKNGGSASRVGHGSMYLDNARILFEYNLFDDESGESEVISAKSSENIFRYNTFKNSRGHLSLRQGERALVYDNYFIGTGEDKHGGLFVRGEGHVEFNNYFHNLNPRPRYKEEGAVSFGAATGSYDGSRSDKGLNGRHFPITRNILFANNTIIEPGDFGIVIGSQFGSRDRTLIPDSLYLQNNQLAGARRQSVLQLDGAKDIVWRANFSSDAIKGLEEEGVDSVRIVVADGPFKLPMPVEAQPGVSGKDLSAYLNKLNLDMTWEENRRIVDRIVSHPATAGFSVPRSPENRPVYPLTKSDVGPQWMIH